MLTESKKSILNEITQSQRDFLSSVNGVIVFRSAKRTRSLTLLAEYTFIYFCFWQFVLIILNVLIVISSVLRRRAYLTLSDRTFYWLIQLQILVLIPWLIGSISVVTRRRENLQAFNTLGLVTLVLILVEFILLLRFICLVLRLKLSTISTLHHYNISYELSNMALLRISQIVLLSLWLYFMNRQLASKPWTLEEFTIKFNDPLSEDYSLNPYAPNLITNVMISNESHS